MQSAKWRLVWLAVTAVLFFAWIGWLASEALHRPIVLARAPFLVAELNVIAQVDRQDAPVTVRTVVWSAAENFYREKGRIGAALAGAPAGPLQVLPALALKPETPGEALTEIQQEWANRRIAVTNLASCGPDWRGPGEYIMPLLEAGPGTYEVADATGLTQAEKKEWMEHGGLPSRSPGYAPEVDRQTRTARPPHIYPLTPETLAQLRQLHQ
jgi:hypothetical protein